MRNRLCRARIHSVGCQHIRHRPSYFLRQRTDVASEVGVMDDAKDEERKS